MNNIKRHSPSSARTSLAAICLGFSFLMFAAPQLRAAAQSQSVLSDVSDGDIQTKVTQALLGTASLQDQAITPATINGEVTLSGVVANQQLKSTAAQVVAGIAGVNAVRNNLKIGDPAAAQSDEDQPAGQPVSQPQRPPAGQQRSAYPSQQPQPVQAGVTPPPPASSATTSAASAPPQVESQGVPPPPPVGDTSAPPSSTYVQGSGPQSSQPAYYSSPSGPVTVPAGTLLRIRTSELIDVKGLQPGTMFEATAASDIYEGNVIAIPRGAVLDGQVVAAKAAGAFGGKPELQLKLTTLNLAGHIYPVATDVWSSQGASKTGYTATNTAGGALVGALLGAVFGGGPGAAVGAVAGGVGGATVSGATQGPRMVLPAETVLKFHLSNAITVQPVSYEEADRLASSQPEQQQQQPQLQRRPVYMAAPPPYAYPYAYYPMYYGRYW